MARKRQYTAWAAALATAAELSRRSYDVTITFGNTPKVDLLCSVPDGKQFKEKEKGDILYSFCQEKKQEKIKSLKTMG